MISQLAVGTRVSVGQEWYSAFKATWPDISLLAQGGFRVHFEPAPCHTRVFIVRGA